MSCRFNYFQPSECCNRHENCCNSIPRCTPWPTVYMYIHMLLAGLKRLKSTLVSSLPSIQHHRRFLLKWNFSISWYFVLILAIMIVTVILEEVKKQTNLLHISPLYISCHPSAQIWASLWTGFLTYLRYFWSLEIPKADTNGIPLWNRDWRLKRISSRHPQKLLITISIIARGKRISERRGGELVPQQVSHWRTLNLASSNLFWDALFYSPNRIIFCKTRLQPLSSPSDMKLITQTVTSPFISCPSPSYLVSPFLWSKPLIF